VAEAVEVAAADAEEETTERRRVASAQLATDVLERRRRS